MRAHTRPEPRCPIESVKETASGETVRGVRRRGNKWQARYKVGDQTHAQTFDTETAAEVWLKSNALDRVRGDWVDPSLGSATTFETMAAMWTASRVHLAESSRARDRAYLNGEILPRFGDLFLSAITRPIVRGWAASQLDAGSAPATVRKRCQIVAAVFDMAIEDRLVVNNPARGVKLPSTTMSGRFLDSGERGRLIAAVDDNHRLLVEAAIATGARWGELAGLLGPKVDPLRRQIVIDASLADVNGKRYLKDTKNAASRRTISIPEWLAVELAVGAGQSGPVFTAPGGGWLVRSNFRRRVWMPATAKAGVEGVRFHDLRHTAVAMLIENGEHPKAIQTRLGHAKIQTTFDVYGHLMPNIDREVADRLTRIETPDNGELQVLKVDKGGQESHG